MARGAVAAVAVVREGRGTHQGLPILISQMLLVVMVGVMMVLLLSPVLCMLVLRRLKQSTGWGGEGDRPFQEHRAAKVALEDGRGGIVSL